MIESLPDRHLTEKEVDKLRESDQFKEIVCVYPEDATAGTV